MPVVRPRVAEITALGAAYLAGLAVGYWKDLDAIRGQWSVDRRFEPALELRRRGESQAGWKRALERAKDWEEKSG